MVVRYVTSASLPRSRSDPTGAIHATGAGMTVPRERRSDIGGRRELVPKQPFFYFPAVFAPALTYI